MHCSCSSWRAGEQNVPRAVFGRKSRGSTSKEWEQCHRTSRGGAPGVGPGVVKTPRGYLLPAPSSDETSRMCQMPFSGEKGSCHLPQGQRCISGPQCREGPWVRISSRQDFDSRGERGPRGSRGRGETPRKFKRAAGSRGPRSRWGTCSPPRDRKRHASTSRWSEAMGR